MTAQQPAIRKVLKLERWDCIYDFWQSYVNDGIAFFIALFLGNKFKKGEIKMKRKTIKSLMSGKKIVYIKLSGEKAAEVFIALAEYEGFRVDEKVKKGSACENYYVKLNEDMSITYPDYSSFAGAMKFHNAKRENGKKVLKVDFEKQLL